MAQLSRLCKRGEAWCGTRVDSEMVAGRLRAVLCEEPAAVAYRISDRSKWSFACREHFGAEETDELREAAQAEEADDG